MSETAEAAWVGAQFDRCASWIQDAVDRAEGCFDIDHVRREIEMGKAQIWPGTASVMVTRIETHPSGVKSLFGWLSGGDLAEIQELRPVVEQWGKSMGCTRVEIVGRRGWLKAFPGFRDAGSILVKDLT